MHTIHGKRRSPVAADSKVVDINTAFKSAARCVRPTVGRSIFARIVYHDSTAKREANHLRMAEAEAYSVLRSQIIDRLAEERRRGFIEGRRSMIPPAPARRVAA